jgi:sensor histidine kinase YesM
MSSRDQRQRTRLVIVRGFQVRFIILIVAFMLLTALVSGYTVYYYIWKLVGDKLNGVYPQAHLVSMVARVNSVLISRFFLLVPLVVLVGLIFSNRISGPIYKMKLFLSSMSEHNDDGSLVELREDDEFHEVAEGINRIVNRLRSEKRKRRSDMVKIGKELDSIVTGISGDGASREALVSLRERIKTLEERGDGC